MKKKLISSVLICSMIMGAAACNAPKKHVETTPQDLPRPIQTTEPSEETIPEETLPDYPCINPSFEDLTAEEICAMLTVEQKANQMIQGANYKMPLDDMQINCYGSVLSYYSSWPALTHEEWKDVTSRYQNAALLSDTRIPYIYGNDCVHGVNMASGTVIFPYNINLGAANDQTLTFEMGLLTGSDMLYTGILWNFAPVCTAAKDPRWGRTYECYSSDESLVIPLATSFARGLMSQGIAPCAKHFMGEGYCVFGTGEGDFLIDRGDAQMTEEEIQKCLDVYKAMIDAGVPSIMISHAAVNGVKMHENGDLIWILKNEYGFKGVIVSDWESLRNCSGSTLKENIVLCVNAGVDMLMEAEVFEESRNVLIEAINDGSIPMERIDDAVTRIIQFKMDLGIFDDPFLDEATPSYEWNSAHAHEVARTLAAESMVPLVLPEDGAFTLEEGMKVFVCGPAANDSGAMCGGWTYIWQGCSDQDIGDQHWCTEGPTILEALQTAADEIGFEIITDEEEIKDCDLVILCVGEKPYAEWYGDSEDISITGELALDGNEEAIELAKSSKKDVLTLIIAGRNVIIDEYVDDWDEVIMCYLPGSEGGNAVADILTGKAEFFGRLPMPYYSSVDQIGTDECWLPLGFSAAEKTEEPKPDDQDD